MNSKKLLGEKATRAGGEQNRRPHWMDNISERIKYYNISSNADRANKFII